jgi:hypothetical protein
VNRKCPWCGGGTGFQVLCCRVRKRTRIPCLRDHAGWVIFPRFNDSHQRTLFPSGTCLTCAIAGWDGPQPFKLVRPRALEGLQGSGTSSRPTSAGAFEFRLGATRRGIWRLSAPLPDISPGIPFPTQDPPAGDRPPCPACLRALQNGPMRCNIIFGRVG